MPLNTYWEEGSNRGGPIHSCPAYVVSWELLLGYFVKQDAGLNGITCLLLFCHNPDEDGMVGGHRKLAIFFQSIRTYSTHYP